MPTWYSKAQADTLLSGKDASGAAAAAQAAAVQRANHTGTQSADTLTDGTTNKAYTATEKTKLAGVASGATANSTDAQLRDRSTHTGQQAASTVTGLATVATTGAYADLTGKPSSPAALTPTATKTAAYTAVVGDLAMMNVAGGATVLTLPTAPADKAQVGYRAIGATDAIPLTINRGGSTDTIGTAGATSASIPMSDETVIVQYDAANTRWIGVANVRTQASVDSRYVPITPVVEGIPLQWASHSYGVHPPFASSASVNSDEPTRISSELRMVLSNRSAGGYWVQDVAANVLGTTSPMTTPGAGVVIVDAGTNDVSSMGTAKARAGVTNGIASIIARAQASSVILESAAAFTYTGTWTVKTGAGYGSGNAKGTVTINDSVSIALPAIATGLNYTQLITAYDSAKVAGCTAIEVKLDGTVISTININDQMAFTTGSGTLPSFGAGFYPLLIPGNGSARTLVLTSKAAGQFNVDDLLIPTATPAQVLVCSAVPWSNASYAGGAGGDTNLALLNTALQAGITMAAPIAGTVNWLDMSPGWVPSTMCFTGDGLHPNDRGRAVRAGLFRTALAALPLRQGMNVL